MGVAVLLDTHVLLWAIGSPEKLSPEVTALLEDPHTTVLISSATAWEIATKFRLGKLTEAEAIVTGYANHLGTLRATEIPISSAHALAAGLMPAKHRDPFDRMLAAQSIAENVPLVTDDPAVAGLPGVTVLWRSSDASASPSS